MRPAPEAKVHGRHLRPWTLAWLAALCLGACAGSVPPLVQASPDVVAAASDATPTDLAAPVSDTHDVAVQAADAGPADAGAACPPACDAAADLAPGDGGPPPTTVFVHHPKAAVLTLRGDTVPLTWTGDLAPTAIEGNVARFELPTVGKAIQVKAFRQGAWAHFANHVVQPHEQRHMYPYFDVKSASPRREDFTLPGPKGGKRTLRAWLPPGYDENLQANYPLLLMMDGQNLFEDGTASFGVSWQLGGAAIAAMTAAKLGEVVIVGIDHAGVQRIDEYTPWPDQKKGQGGGGVQFVDWVQTTVLPDLAQRYRLKPGREARAIGGSSLGALISLYAAMAQPQTWGAAVCMSGAWWWQGKKMQTWVGQAYDPKLPLRIWLDAGDVDDGLEETQALRDALLALGIPTPLGLGYYVAKGANHSEAAWAKRAHLPLQFLFDPGNLEKPF